MSDIFLTEEILSDIVIGENETFRQISECYKGDQYTITKHKKLLVIFSVYISWTTNIH